jgi:two-component system, cell cycle response regulator DivK
MDAPERVITKTILIVEDNDLNFKLVDELLRYRGYKTMRSIDGIDVIGLVRKQRPDLIVMDIQLPDMSGEEITRLIKAEVDLCSIPILAMTASAMRGDEERIRASGCDDYMSKPINLAEFSTMITHLLA